MKVVHIESGLGNQMLSYCEYLAIKQANPNDDIYIETIVYDIPECNDVICQWGGYELNRIFGIETPNIKDFFSDDQWGLVVDSVKRTQFWLHNWNWPVYFQQAFDEVGLHLLNLRGDFESKGYPQVGSVDINRKSSLRDVFRTNPFYRYLQMLMNRYRDRRDASSINNENIHFYHSDDSFLTGQRLTFKAINSGIEKIEHKIRSSFQFPTLTDDYNIEILRKIKSCNSVAIHVRRGDLLGVNDTLYRFGYFKRCVHFIRTKVERPEFFIFCAKDSAVWVRNNLSVLGLTSKDSVHFVDCNSAENSYRDMQLMSNCLHQVVTYSSFGWWGAWLNQYPGKITCSPSVLINTTHHF